MTEAYGRMTKERVFTEGQLVLKAADHVRRGIAGPFKFSPKWEGPFCDKRGACKWVLLFGPDGWQRSYGSHQWQVAKTLLFLKEKVM